MRRGLPLLVAVLAVALAACGDEEDSSDERPAADTTATASPPSEPDPEPEPEPAREPEPEPEPDEGDTDSAAFRNSKDLCSLFPVNELAREYGAEGTDPGSVADAYARQSYRGAFQADARAGCLAGIEAGG